MIKEDIEKDLHVEKGRREESKGDRDRKRKKEAARIMYVDREREKGSYIIFIS